jgi:hypothetical protein
MFYRIALVSLLESSKLAMARQTNCLQVIQSIATIRVNVVYFQVVYFTALALRLVATLHTRVSISLKRPLAIHHVRRVIPAGGLRCLIELRVLDDFKVCRNICISNIPGCLVER